MPSSAILPFVSLRTEANTCLLNVIGKLYHFVVSFPPAHDVSFIHCTLQWGTTERPANYTVAAQLPIAYTSTAYIILGIGIVAPDDNNAKNVSNIYNLTTKTSVSFRTENENAPSVRYITIGR